MEVVDYHNGSHRTDLADRRQKFLIGLWLRVAAAGSLFLFLGLFTLFGETFPWQQAYLAYLGLAALVLVNVLYWAVGSPRAYPLNDFYVHWFVDLILITVVVVGLNRPSLSAAISGYILIVVSSAVFISSRASFVVATGASLAVVMLFLAEAVGWLSPQPGTVPDVGRELFVTSGSVLLIYLIAYIAGTLADRLNAANRLLFHKNAELNGKNAELEELQAELELRARVLTHDIGSPMSAMSVALALIREELARLNTSTEADRLLALIQENVDRVHDMIEALQQVQEVGDGHRLEEQLEEKSLQSLWSELESEFSPAIAAANIVIHIEDGDRMMKVVKSKALVALRNLVMNAIRYVPHDGSGLLRIGCEDRVRDWCLWVADNGPGVPESYQNLVFEMFRKAPQMQRSPGLGVGLALVKKIAELHGGMAWVESCPGGGAKFMVTFSKSRVDGRQSSEVNE